VHNRGGFVARREPIRKRKGLKWTEGGRRAGSVENKIQRALEGRGGCICSTKMGDDAGVLKRRGGKPVLERKSVEKSRLQWGGEMGEGGKKRFPREGAA